MIKGFIFDMDGVLTSSSEEHFEAWCTILKDRDNLIVPQSAEKRTRGVDRPTSLNNILDEMGIPDKYSDKEKAAICYDKNELYKKLIEKFTPANRLPGVTELLDKLDKMPDISLAIGSASKNRFTLMNKLQIDSYFKYCANTKHNFASKPDPAIFDDAAKGLGLENAECIGIEDAIAGVSAIKNAGMFAVGIGDSDALSEADIVFASMAEFDLEKVLEMAQK